MADCIGCGGPAVAGVHRLIIDADHNEVAWHPDCHVRSANGCELCAKVVAAYPELKDQALGEAIVANNPNGA
jgi:hypothetical protein